MPLTDREKEKFHQDLQSVAPPPRHEPPLSCYGVPPKTGPRPQLEPLYGLSVMALAARKATSGNRGSRLRALKDFLKDGAILARVDTGAHCQFTLGQTPEGCTTLAICAPLHYDAAPVCNAETPPEDAIKRFVAAVSNGWDSVRVVRIPPAGNDGNGDFDTLCLQHLLKDHTLPWIDEHHADWRDNPPSSWTHPETNLDDVVVLTPEQQHQWLLDVFEHFGVEFTTSPAPTSSSDAPNPAEHE